MADPLSPSASSMMLHATTVAVGDDCVAITGPSGSGKTSIALQCLAVPAGPYCHQPPSLLSDDQTTLTLRDGALWATAPETLAGLVEARGIGVVTMPTITTARLRCLVRLTDQPVPRLPEATTMVSLLDCDIPAVDLDGRDPTTPLKTLIWLAISSEHLNRVDTVDP